MDTITRLSAIADQLIELGGIALGGGRVRNPLYDPTASDRTLRPHRIGKGTERSVPLSRVISRQATILQRSVNSMAGKIKRGTFKGKAPTVQRSGPKFIVHDGNHTISAHIKAGKRVMKMKVQ